MKTINKKAPLLCVPDFNDEPIGIELTPELLERQMAGRREISYYNLIQEIAKPFFEAYDRRHPEPRIYLAA